jgi:hypothetical protein
MLGQQDACETLAVMYAFYAFYAFYAWWFYSTFMEGPRLRKPKSPRMERIECTLSSRMRQRGAAAASWQSARFRFRMAEPIKPISTELSLSQLLLHFAGRPRGPNTTLS